MRLGEAIRVAWEARVRRRVTLHDGRVVGGAEPR